MKKKRSSGSVSNRRASFDYELGEQIIAGLELTGPEVKSLRMNRASLRGAFVTFKDGELYLNNLAVVPMPTNTHHLKPDELSRPRKLLVTKKQREELLAVKNAGQTIVALKILNGRYIKVVIAPGKGKKNYDKRQTLKQRDDARQSQREIRRFKS